MHLLAYFRHVCLSVGLSACLHVAT
jgi:hypothetical protein